jgi:hypothetical protein
VRNRRRLYGGHLKIEHKLVPFVEWDSVDDAVAFYKSKVWSEAYVIAHEVGHHVSPPGVQSARAQLWFCIDSLEFSVGDCSLNVAFWAVDDRKPQQTYGLSFAALL